MVEAVVGVARAAPDGLSVNKWNNGGCALHAELTAKVKATAVNEIGF